MIENLDILFGVASQNLVFDAPEGRPSSVTSSTVFENAHSDEATVESATTGSAAIETTPDTTVDAASGYGEANPKIINVAATTGAVVGRRYLATTADGEAEWFEVREIASGVSLTARKPFANTYASADTVESTRITHGVLDAWAAAKTNLSPLTQGPRYRWRVEYVVASVSYVAQVYFDLVRYSAASTVTGLDVDRAYPWINWLHALPTHDREDQGANIIKEAYRQVRLHLATAGKAIEAARNREVMEDLVIHRAASLAVGRDIEAAETIEKNYERQFNNFIVTPKAALPFDPDGSGSASPSKASPMWRR